MVQVPWSIRKDKHGGGPQEPRLSFAWGGVQSKTKIKLGATAGLRLLPGGQADKILEAVKAYFAQQPFILDPEFGVTILDGEPSPPIVDSEALSHVYGKFGNCNSLGLKYANNRRAVFA